MSEIYIAKRETVESVKKTIKQARNRYILVNVILLIILLALAFTLLVYGDGYVSIPDIWNALTSGSHRGAGYIVWVARMPKIVSALFAGFAFGIAGNVFQSIFRNPLVSPNIIGVTSGSTLVAAFCYVILAMTSNRLVSLFAIGGGLLTCLVVFLLSTISKGGFSTSKMILIGVGVQVMLTSLISYIMSINETVNIAQLMTRLTGSINASALDSLYPLMIISLFVVPLIVSFEKDLEVMQLGEETAKVLGSKTNVIKVLLMILSVILVAFATSVTGPIAFVSFLAGPIVKKLLGNNKIGLFSSGMMASIIVMASELIASYALPLDYPVGVITGLIGAPYLLYLVMVANKKGLF
jgi:iron complex transport system permease protein